MVFSSAVEDREVHTQVYGAQKGEGGEDHDREPSSSRGPVSRIQELANVLSTDEVDNLNARRLSAGKDSGRAHTPKERGNVPSVSLVSQGHKCHDDKGRRVCGEVKEGVTHNNVKPSKNDACGGV
jgi:hypothetical protein